jgi:hypothetical protein
MKLLEAASEFGARLITTGDLDPVYVALWHANRQGVFSGKQLERWLLAYWLFYDCGEASRLAEQDSSLGFYHALSAALPRAHRGAERRHFRGVQARRCVDWLRSHYSEPADFVWSLVNWQPLGANVRFSTVWKRLTLAPMFGQWIAWKASDMLERVLDWPVEFRGAEMAMHTDPLVGARLVATGELGQPADAGMTVSVVQALVAKLSAYKAPPSDNRGVGLQEVETVLCKFKSHFKGHYRVGKDTVEIQASLERANCRLANQLAKHLSLHCKPASQLV